MAVKAFRGCSAEASTAASACLQCGAHDPTRYPLIPVRARLPLGFFLAIGIAYLASFSPSSSETAQPKSETITIAETDYGCADKAVTEEAIRRPLQWQPNPRGRKGFWLPYGDGFYFYKCDDAAAHELGQPRSGGWGGPQGTITWSAGDKARGQKRDGELACLEPLEGPHTGICFWTAIERSPSKRAAGPMPSEDSKPPYEKSLMDVAENEIEDALEARGYSAHGRYSAEKFRAETELMQKQATPYLHESDRYLSVFCNPDLSHYPYLTSNDKELSCDNAQAHFQRNYGLALKGDYEAQQSASNCLFPKVCEGVVTTNVLLGCAWQMVP